MSSETDHSALVNSQRCMRLGGKHNDFSAVGKSPHHLSYFEMLGSWSFNRKFSPLIVCQHALTLLTQVFNIDQSRLSVTYFGGDDELGIEADEDCARIWQSLGFAPSTISSLGKEDNLWTMGDTGPCGPCTEIHFQPHDLTQPPVELWNIVFMRYNLNEDGSVGPLGTEHIDTGMGLERLAALMQTGDSCVFKSDLFTPIFDSIARIYSPEDLSSEISDDVNARIIADHSRGVCAALADGFRPGAEKAPQRIRKLIRHGVYRGSVLAGMDANYTTGMFTQVCSDVIPLIQDAIPHILDCKSNIIDSINIEEIKFTRSLQAGAKMWNKFKKRGATSTSQLFMLYNTHGLPREIISDICEKGGIEFNGDEFDQLMQEHVAKSKMPSNIAQRQ